MANQTRTRPSRAQTDKPDTPVEAEPVESPTTDETPESDTPVEAPVEAPVVETDIPALPDDFTPNHPLVARALEMVTTAEEHKDDPTPIADFVAAADKLFNLPTGFAVAEALGTDIEAGVATYESFKTLVDTLRTSVETVNRQEGDELLGALVALAKVPMGGIEDESDKLAIPVLSARWAASAPKKGTSGSSGASRGDSDVPNLTFPDGSQMRIRYICGQCGKKFSTRKENLNSHRREIIKHMVRSHPAQNSPAKWEEGSESFKAVTSGFFALGCPDGAPGAKAAKRINPDERVDEVTRGGWRFVAEAA